MTELMCEQARDLAPEYGLGILAPEDRAAMAAHVLRCPECRSEVDDYAQLSDDLMTVIPAAEPPPGFDRRVLESLHPRRRPLKRVLMGGVGAAVAAAAAVAIVLTVTSGPDNPPKITASLVAHGHSVGSVYTEGRPPYLWMAVENIGVSGTVSCQVVEADGNAMTLGTFDLIDGSGGWATPEPPGLGRIASVRLLAGDGKVLAQATFKT
jgi:predicted anti-sigma-YlaC factor YlaD